MFSQNYILQILVDNVDEYVDLELNEEVLIAVKIMVDLTYDVENEGGPMWNRFCQLGGKVKLQRYLTNCKCEDLHNFTNGILSKFKVI